MESSSRKIYRSKSDYFLAGVAGGLSSYFGVDTTIVRIIFILLTIWGGSGILVYIVLWLFIPKEPVVENNVDREKKAQQFAINVKDKVQEMAKSEKINRNLFLGIIFILIGLIALWNRFLPMGIRWDFFWPIIAILIGLYIIFKK